MEGFKVEWICRHERKRVGSAVKLPFFRVSLRHTEKWSLRESGGLYATNVFVNLLAWKRLEKEKYF